MTPSAPIADWLLHRTLGTFFVHGLEAAALVEAAIEQGADVNRALVLPGNPETDRPMTPLDRLFWAWGRSSWKGPFKATWQLLRDRGATAIHPDAWRMWLESNREWRDLEELEEALEALEELKVPMDAEDPHEATLIDRLAVNAFDGDVEWWRRLLLLVEHGGSFHADRHVVHAVNWLYQDPDPHEYWIQWMGQLEAQLGPSGLTTPIEPTVAYEGYASPPSEMEGAAWTPAGWLVHRLMEEAAALYPQNIGGFEASQVQSIEALWLRWDAFGVDWTRPAYAPEVPSSPAPSVLDLLDAARNQGLLVEFPALVGLLVRHHLQRDVPLPAPLPNERARL